MRIGSTLPIIGLAVSLVIFPHLQRASASSPQDWGTCLSKILDQMLRSSLDHYAVQVPVADTRAPIFFLRGQQSQFLEKLLRRHGDALQGIDHKILEVGFGSPSLIEALRRATGAQADALDLYEVPGTWIELMPDIHFISGRLPQDGITRSLIRKRGPYDLVIAQDVWKAGHEFRWGEPFDPGVPIADYLEWLREITRPDGVVAALNDFGAELAFTREQITDAGFRVTSWNEPIVLPLDARSAPKLRARYGERLGDLRYFEFVRSPLH